MKRILVLCADHGIPLNGTKGASVHLRAMARALAAEGLSVAVACRGADGPPGWGLPAFHLPARPKPADEEFTPASMNARDAETLDEIHARFPFDAIYERYSLWATAGLDAARSRQIPFVLEVNAPLTREAARWRSMPFEEAARSAEIRLAREADGLAPVSAPLARHLESLGADPARIEAIPNGVDDAFLRVGQERFSGDACPEVSARRGPRLIFVGSLKPWHGVDVLLEAFARLRGSLGAASLRILGDGPGRDVVRSAAAADPSISWSGPLSHAAIPAELRHADIALAPYREDGEGYFSPLKVIEYQAAGLPVVASGGAGVSEALQGGATGLLVPSGDAAALAAGILDLAADPGRAHALARAGWAAAGARGWRANARRVLALLDAPVPR